MSIAEKMAISVLVVEDEALIREQMAQMIQRRCSQVYTAINGKDALEKLSAHEIDVIISDVDMPVMNGIELLKAVRDLSSSLPFIIATGLKNLDVLISAIEYNVSAFIPKPVQKNDLFDKLSAVSVQKQLSFNLKQNQNLLDQYKFIVDQSALVSKTDPEGIITFVNDNFCALSGYTREELVGEPHNIVRDPDMPSETFQDLWNTIGAKKVWRGIIHNRTKNGERYTVKSTIAPILDMDGQVIEYMSIREDITQLEKSKEEALSASRIKSDFLANMSHEIRTPMNGILGFTTLLEKTELNEKQKKYLNIINSSASSLLGIINDILDFSKLESGKFELDNTAWNPFVEFQKISSLFSAKIEEKNIVFDHIVEPDVSECVYADLLRLQQVISNLLSNAIKFTPEGGNIVFYAKRLNTEVSDLYRIGVRDSGIGINPEQAAHIFDPFSQADTSITRRFGGTGLGLSISSHLVSLMGGEIRLESTLGVGSDFYFDIPLRTCEETHPISDLFGGMKVGIYDSESEDHPCQQKVIAYLSKLHIPYHVRSVSELNDFLSPHEIHLFFCNVPTSELIRLDRIGVQVIIACAHTAFDFSPYSSVHSIVDLDHNLSSLYNVLLLIATQKQTLPRTLEVQSKSIFSGSILVAEDNEVNRQLIEELLQAFEIQFQTAINGIEAVHAARGKSFDLILMDINMPIMDGIEALKLIREFDQKTPIVALTANAMEGDRDKILKEGFDAYLTKPIILDDLKAVMEEHLHHSEKSIDQSYLPINHSTSIVDFKAIQEAFPLSDKVIYKLLKSYYDTCDGALKNLSQAIDEKSPEKIESASHMIKGSAANLRFEPLVAVAAEMEEISRKKEMIDYGPLYSKIAALTQQIKSEIEELLDGREQA